MMRVGLVAWDYPPSPSGLSTAAREIAESLAGAGAEVTIFTLDREGRSRDGAITIVGCRPPAGGWTERLREFAGIGHLAAPFCVRRAVLADHRARPFDVVEATNWYAPAILLAVPASVPLVTRNSTPAAFSRTPPRTLRDRFDAWVADLIERVQAARSVGLISNTGEHARRIGAEYRLAADRQPHAVVGLSLPPATIARGRAADYPALTEGEPVRLLFVGRAEHRKGFDILMEAVALLADEHAAGRLPPFMLTLVGVPAADLPHDLPPRARERIVALGRLPEAELALQYERAHAVLAPSRYESFGLVYQEGIAYGRPMVACAEDASGREFVGDTGAGLMAREATGEAMAEAMRPIVSDPAVRAALRQKALEAAGRFTRETLGQQTMALYERALRQGR